MDNDDNLIFCLTQGCNFEASEERETPDGDTINLCYTCSQG